MKRSVRLWLFLISGAALASLMLWGFKGLPPFGYYPGPYGYVLNSHEVGDRHATNVVTAVNFDYRGLDTMGEEYIFFGSVAGLLVLLRVRRGETEDEPREAAPGRTVQSSYDGIQAAGLIMSGCTVLFGLYIVLHGQLTPGGGFQGGAILGTASLLVYLAVGYQAFKAVSPHPLADLAESAGAASYVIIGLATLIISGYFLKNVMPLGDTGSLASSGTIAVINFMVGVEISTGFVVLFSEFLKGTRRPSDKDAGKESGKDSGQEGDGEKGPEKPPDPASPSPAGHPGGDGVAGGGRIARGNGAAGRKEPGS